MEGIVRLYFQLIPSPLSEVMFVLILELHFIVMARFVVSLLTVGVLLLVLLLLEQRIVLGL